MLFPGERHTYRPDANTGWTEYWVGFKGDGADEWIRNGYFSPSTPLLNIGISQSILELYTNILEVVEEERTDMQFLLRVLYAICWEKCIIKVNAGLILLFWIK